MLLPRFNQNSWNSDSNVLNLGRLLGKGFRSSVSMLKSISAVKFLEPRKVPLDFLLGLCLKCKGTLPSGKRN